MIGAELARKEKGITQKMIGEHLRVSQEYVSMVLAGKKKPSSLFKMKLAAYLNVPKSELFAQVGATDSPQPLRWWSSLWGRIRAILKHFRR